MDKIMDKIGTITIIKFSVAKFFLNLYSTRHIIVALNQLSNNPLSMEEMCPRTKIKSF